MEMRVLSLHYSDERRFVGVNLGAQWYRSGFLVEASVGTHRYEYAPIKAQQ